MYIDQSGTMQVQHFNPEWYYNWKHQKHRIKKFLLYSQRRFKRLQINPNNASLHIPKAREAVQLTKDMRTFEF
jgi:hypothetical protein